MRQKLAVLLAALMLTGILGGCEMIFHSREEAPAQESGEEPEAVPEPAVPDVPMTPQLAAEINGEIDPADVNLAQLGSTAGLDSVVIKTSKGDIPVVLFREQAPKAVENFMTHAKNGYYNGMSFQRVLNNFLVELGAPEGGGASIYTDEEGNPVPFADEFSLDLWHFRGALSMSGEEPDSNGSQFFIVQAPYVNAATLEEMESIAYPEKVIDAYASKGGIPAFDWRNTVFGMVTLSGMETVDAIAKLPVDADGKPEETVIIETIEIQHELEAEEDTGAENREEETAPEP